MGLVGLGKVLCMAVLPLSSLITAGAVIISQTCQVGTFSATIVEDFKVILRSL